MKFKIKRRSYVTSIPESPPTRLRSMVPRFGRAPNDLAVQEASKVVYGARALVLQWESVLFGEGFVSGELTCAERLRSGTAGAAPRGDRRDGRAEARQLRRSTA